MPLGDRISHFDENYRLAVEAFSEQYNPDFDVEKNFTANGIRFFDQAGNSVSILSAENRVSMLYTKPPYTDVTVFEVNGVIRGWIHSGKMIDADHVFLTPLESLEPMPIEFKFAVSCPHLVVYGGYQMIGEDYWKCFNCGKSIVPSSLSKTSSR